MNKPLIMLSAVLLLIVASCKKSSDKTEEPQSVSKNCKLTQVKSTGNPTIYYGYTNDGKLSRIDNGIATSTDFETFTFTSGKLTNYYEYPISNGKATGTTNFTLDANGRISTVTTSIPSTTTFTYDSNGYLIKGVTVNSSGTFTWSYTWTDGNLTKITEPNGTVTTLAYNAEESRDNLINNTLMPLNFSNYSGFDISNLVRYMGSRSKNLIVKTTEVGANKTYTANYTYTKDAAGNITKLHNVWINVGSSTSNGSYDLEFVYDCN
jgi:hypothetical protein